METAKRPCRKCGYMRSQNVQLTSGLLKVL